MRRKTLGLTVVSALVLVAIAVAGAMAMKPAAPPAAAPSAAPSLAQEALAYRYGTRHASGIPVPVAREKASREASREIVAGFAQRAYEDLAYPRKAVATAQLEGALEAMRRHGRGEDRRSRRWEEVGPFTLDVAREATQNNGLTTEWSGRLTAMAVDPKCDSHHCRLYVGAAGGGVWRTDNALSRNPHWKPLDRGLDTTSIGALLIDPTDKSGHTIYVGTGEPSGSGDSEAGLGLYKSTDRGEHWKLVPGSYAVSKDRGIGEIAVDPKNPQAHLARHDGRPACGLGCLRWSLHAARCSDDRPLRVHGRRCELPAALQPAAGSCEPELPERERLLQGRSH